MSRPQLQPGCGRGISGIKFKEKSMGTLFTVLGAIGSTISIATFMKSLS
ncbi:hypothetical protein BTZ20_1118 [Rhodococcus sp. MTM3W5.2]|nr:hypothetical protein BTZ20_1118 [Rhodococcus sp. MTM3W5.2]